MKVKLVMILVLLMIAPVMAINVPEESGDMTKMIIIDVNSKNINGERLLTNTSVRVGYGYPSSNIVWEDLIIEVFDKDTVIDRFGIGDPSMLIGDSVEYLDDSDFSISVLYQEGIRTVQITDGYTNELLLTVDVTRALREFCNNSMKDEECDIVMSAPPEMNFDMNSVGIVIAIVVLLLGGLILYMKHWK